MKQDIPLNVLMASAEVRIELYSALVARHPDEHRYVKNLRDAQRELLDLRIMRVQQRAEEA